MSSLYNSLHKLACRARRLVHTLTSPDSGLSGSQRRELRRLAALPRYEETATDLLGFYIQVPDGPSFASMWKGIFLNNFYRFPSVGSRPRILDCGANIGLSCVFFKKVFPDARITAFEPDPKIFSYLEGTLKSAKLYDIELVKKAVWSSETKIHFRSEGADAGSLDLQPESQAPEIETVRLRDFLSETVDLLKIDIEGAETDVLIDCADSLSRVDRIFVEYHSFAGKPQTLHQLLTILYNAGFRVHIHPELTSPVPFIAVGEYLGMDLQLNIFGYRGAP